MKKPFTTLALGILIVGTATAQQTPRSSNRQSTDKTGMSTSKSANSARSTYSNNGTNPSGGTGTTLDQNSASASAAGPSGTSGTTKTDNRSSVTTGSSTKPRTKPSELVNLKKNN